jgi:predicted TPR repeat methyltransferase
MADGTENQMGRVARYDGWANWYDEYLTTPLYEKVPAHLARLVGRGRGLCVDLGCGTGVHLEVFGSPGWSVVGVDLSAHQMCLASDRWPLVVQADVCDLPYMDLGWGNMA